MSRRFVYALNAERKLPGNKIEASVVIPDTVSELNPVPLCHSEKATVFQMV